MPPRIDGTGGQAPLSTPVQGGTPVMSTCWCRLSSSHPDGEA